MCTEFALLFAKEVLPIVVAHLVAELTVVMIISVLLRLFLGCPSAPVCSVHPERQLGVTMVN